MATYNVNGQVYNLPDGIDDDQAMKIIQSDGSTSPNGGEGASPSSSQAAPDAANYSPAPSSVDPATLASSPDWVRASAVRFKSAHPGEPLPSPADLAEFGLDQMGWFNYNTPAMAVDANQLRSASAEDKKAFLYLMDTYDKLELSWGGAGRFIKGAALDPLNYVGLGTLGLGVAAGTATRIGSKEALKSMMRAGIQYGIEGALQSGVQDSIHQNAEINAGGKDEFSYGELAKSAGVGFVAGGVLGGAAEGAGTLVRGIGKGAAKEVPIAEAGRPLESPSVSSPVREAPHGETPAGEAPVAAPAVEPDGQIRMDLGEAPTVAPPVTENPILAAIKDVTDNNGMRYNPTGEARTAQAADPISEILKLTPETAKPLIEEVRQAVLTGNEGDTLLASISQATEKLLRQRNDEFVIARDAVTPAAKAQATEQLQKLDQILDIVRKLDLDTSSTQGSAFAGRNNLMNTGAFREVSPESIMAAKGIDPRTATPMQIADARNEFGEKLFQRIEVASKSPEVYRLLTELEGKLAVADNTGAIATHTELAALKQHLADVMSKDPALGQQIAGGFNKVMAGVNEYVISEVFTTKTTIINMLPSLMKLIYRPALDAIVRGPLDSVSWRMAGAQYATMALHIDTAWKAGVAAFRYEKGILSTDFTKYLEHDPVFAKWYGGGVLRILPRILNATDEMFSQLAYRGFVASESTGFALKQGSKLGYTGQALEDFVKDTVSKNMANGFDGNVGVGALDMLRKEGISRGMSGDKLTEWMKLELDKNQDLLRTATNQSGINYANDLLFKREFSGEGGVSMLAKEYERFVNRVPVMRLVGQLFFRTPVRVFEEGFRLTPGLNLISGVVGGQFLKDLAGKNGVPAQVRAQGEAMVSMALGAMVMNMYAQGKITGGGPDNWKAGRTLEDGKKFSPYTIKIGDHELNFRNLDPFSTPLKIMANALDRISVLRYREAQGDYQNKTAYQHTAAIIGVAWLSIVKAVQDANLTDGISQLSQAMTDLADPEHKEIALTKWLGQKAALLVPNQLNKLVTLGEDNPAMNDPVTAEQYVRGRFNPNDPLVPKRYNALGRVVEVENPWAGITGIDLQTSKKSYSKDELVLQELGKLAINGDKSFNAPYAVSYVPAWQGHDLRLMPSSDGKTSMYDKWQQYIAKTGMTDALYNALVENKGGSMGTKITPGSRELIATQITNGFRKQAFMQMLMDETNGLKTLQDSKIEQGKAKSGQRDAPSMPWN